MDIKTLLSEGGIGVLATDTLYGIVAKATNPKSVERIYRLKGRRPDKPMIILVSEVEEMGLFGVTIDQNLCETVNRYWPGPVSVILPCGADFAYLHRGRRSLAFRLPDKPSLRRLISETGPLVAPSANPEGMPPAETIGQARSYFADKVDFYRRGRISKTPSKLIRLNGGNVETLRG